MTTKQLASTEIDNVDKMIDKITIEYLDTDSYGGGAVRLIWPDEASLVPALGFEEIASRVERCFREAADDLSHLQPAPA